eukprot:gene14500-17114_t
MPTAKSGTSAAPIQLPTPSILHQSIGSTSELFNKSLISSFLNSNQNNNFLNSISPPTTPRTSFLPKDVSYDTKDTFTITVSNSELNSMISDNSSGSISGSSFQKLSASSSSRRTNPQSGIESGGYTSHNPMHNNTSNSSMEFFMPPKKDLHADYSKDITFLQSEHESPKEKSNTSSSSRSQLVVPQRPRGRSISDSLFMSSNSTKDCINDITFVQKVGEGAFSEVWEGWWKGIHVAVKKLKIIGDEEQFKERFLREVENLKKGNHQNIVMFMGACYKPACIITEYMSGGSLYNVLHNPNLPRVKYSFPLVLKMATDIALGLMHLHSINIVHRDLTSQNILLDELGNLKISDFGLSREKPKDGSATMTNGGICNPRWRPPEITKNLGHYSEKMDVYCFSLVVWELLTGEIPFAELDGSQASAQVAYAGLRPIVPDTCDHDFRDLLIQCWDSEASNRPVFTDVVAKLKDISWNNPIGFVSEQFRDISSESSTPRSISPTKN